MSKPPWLRIKKSAVSAGYRSGLEMLNFEFLQSRGCCFEYEPTDKKIRYVEPAREHTYLPDFVLSNGIIVETKGRFDSSDRKKHILIKSQYPELDIRFVFSNPNAPIYKGSPTTCSAWCDRHGFKWAAKCIPVEWLNEKPRGYVRHEKEAICGHVTNRICIDVPARRTHGDDSYNVG